MKQLKIYEELEAISKDTDPWTKDATYYAQSNQHILDLVNMVPHDSILDVGCASGEITKLLTTISNDVTGIDVSKSAIERAKKNVPQAKFEVASLEDFQTTKKYDVIVCAEILCYILDRKQALQKLKQLGKYLVTSNFIICLPIASLKGAQYEMDLRKFPLKKRIIEGSLRHKMIDIKSLRQLS